MGQLLTGVAIFLFGLVIGGVGLATMGVGIGIPMIPLGLYLVFRGNRAMHLKKKRKPAPTFERTRTGSVLFGALLVVFGVATSALLIGIPIGIIGAGLILHGLMLR